jgi:hypothetical protein
MKPFEGHQQMKTSNECKSRGIPESSITNNILLCQQLGCVDTNEYLYRLLTMIMQKDSR